MPDAFPKGTIVRDSMNLIYRYQGLGVNTGQHILYHLDSGKIFFLVRDEIDAFSIVDEEI